MSLTLVLKQACHDKEHSVEVTVFLQTQEPISHLKAFVNVSSLAAFAGRVLYVYKLGYPRRHDPVKYKAVMKVGADQFWILGGLED